MREALFQALDVVLVTDLVAFLTDPATSGIFHWGNQEEDAFEVTPTSDLVVEEANGPHDHPVISPLAIEPKQQHTVNNIARNNSDCISYSLHSQQTIRPLVFL